MYRAIMENARNGGYSGRRGAYVQQQQLAAKKRHAIRRRVAAARARRAEREARAEAYRARAEAFQRSERERWVRERAEKRRISLLGSAWAAWACLTRRSAEAKATRRQAATAFIEEVWRAVWDKVSDFYIWPEVVTRRAASAKASAAAALAEAEAALAEARRQQAEAEAATERARLLEPCAPYPHLFHKYVLELADPSRQIAYDIASSTLTLVPHNGLVAHLHCYDLSKFAEIYGASIGVLKRYFAVIVTYSVGECEPGLSSVVLLRIPNRGMQAMPRTFRARLCFWTLGRFARM